LVAGFAIIQAKSKEDAIEQTKHFLKTAGDGETEIRQVYEGAECAPETHAQAFREQAQKRAVNQ
jgi:hypothetical protein